MGWSMQGFTSLTIPTGATTGKRIVIANPVTGDALDVYDDANELVADINSNGIYQESITGANPSGVDYRGNGIFFTGNTLGDTGHITYKATTTVSGQPNIQIQLVNGNGTSTYSLTFSTAGENGTGTATATGTERGITGSLVQSDQGSTDNLIHVTTVTLTGNGVGRFTANHGAAFTPNRAILSESEPSAAFFGPIIAVVDRSAYTGTQFSGEVYNGSAHYSGSVDFDCVFFG